MKKPIRESDQILRLENHPGPGPLSPVDCLACGADVTKMIVAGRKIQTAEATSSFQLCNVCLSRLRELIAAYEHAEPAPKREPAACLTCQHGQGAHYRASDVAGCGMRGCDCPGFTR